MSRWLDSPGTVIILSIGGGAVVAAIVVLAILYTVDGGGGDNGETTATPTVDLTPAATPSPAGPTPTPGPGAATVSTGLTDPDAALEAFILSEYSAEHIGECPQSIRPGQRPTGLCSEELYRADVLVTFLLGEPFSEFFGEAILRRGEDGTWTVTFLPAPPFDRTIEVGSDAFVYAAGSCLRFRAEPAASASIRSCQADGTRARVVEGPVEADGHTWWRLEGYGWASGLYLAPAE